MNHLVKKVIGATLGLCTITAFAAPPKQLVTHNTTSVESNAFIDGIVESQHPTKAYSDGKVFWTGVRIACFGHTTLGKCSALIKMATDTANPVELGYVQMDLNTGDITPKYLSANGYILTVNGPGETTISKAPE